MGFFKIFYLCFCSILPYEEVAFRWRWKALTYFFALCLISFCGTFIGTRGFVEKACRDIIEPISKQMELIKVKDGKIDLTLQREGRGKVKDFSKELLEYIRQHQGHIPLTDKSPAEDIYATFGVSKKTFKQAVGDLYKRRLVLLEPDGIRLL